MTLKIVSINSTDQVHSVRIDDGVVTVIAIKNGSDMKVSDMEKIFPSFKEIIDNSMDTAQLLSDLQQANSDYIWAHVSGKI